MGLVIGSMTYQPDDKMGNKTNVIIVVLCGICLAEMLSIK